jgi:RHS repeat-associated protein
VDGVGYTGHVMDQSSGLIYMQQRYYDPAIGRFLSVDPSYADPSSGGNFNRYWYANNSPYRFTDPDGRLAATSDSDACGVTGCETGSCSPCSGGDEADEIAAQVQHDFGRVAHTVQKAKPIVGKAVDTVDEEATNWWNWIPFVGGAKTAERASAAGLERAGAGGIAKFWGSIKQLFGAGSTAERTVFRADTSHIFRSAKGHLPHDTPANRALLQGVVKPGNIHFERTIPGGRLTQYREKLADGREVWVEVRNGVEISNGGVNVPN